MYRAWCLTNINLADSVAYAATDFCMQRSLIRKLRVGKHGIVINVINNDISSMIKPIVDKWERFERIAKIYACAAFDIDILPSGVDSGKYEAISTEEARLLLRQSEVCDIFLRF